MSGLYPSFHVSYSVLSRHVYSLTLFRGVASCLVCIVPFLVFSRLVNNHREESYDRVAPCCATCHTYSYGTTPLYHLSTPRPTPGYVSFRLSYDVDRSFFTVPCSTVLSSLTPLLSCVLSLSRRVAEFSDFVPWCCVMSGLYRSFFSVFSSCKQSS